MQKNKMPVPTEAQEQMTLFSWAAMQSGQYHGLYIELKRQRGGRTSDHQSEWLDALSAQGYKAALCYGWEQAAGTIIEYLTGGGTHD